MATFATEANTQLWFEIEAANILGINLEPKSNAMQEINIEIIAQYAIPFEFPTTNK